VRTCASVNRRSPRRIIAPRLRLVQKSSWN
jgi:hypothetical protein